MLRILLAVIAVTGSIEAVRSAQLESSESYWPTPRLWDIQQPPQTKAAATSNEPGTNNRGTEASPVIVKIMPAQKTAAESAEDQQEREEKASADLWTLWLTGSLAFVGALQLLVFGYQALKLRQTIQAMKDIAAGQSADMQNSIAEAARAASAMQEVSRSMDINAREIIKSVKISKEIADGQRLFGEMQMRAYVSVSIGGGIFQDRERGLRFEARPQLRNTGNTPAHKVRFRVASDILPVPLPKDFKFKLPPDFAGGALLAPQQPAQANAVVKEFAPDEDVANIKIGNGKSLFVWGYVIYEDAFKKNRRVTFAQQITFLGQPGSEIVSGFYLTRHNRSN